MSIVFLKFSLNIVKSLVTCAYYSQFRPGEEVHQMMNGRFKKLISPLVTGWVTYLDDLAHKLDVKLL